MHSLISSAAIIVACLGSFRTLFTTKERARQAEEDGQRERYMNESPGMNLRVIKARAKYFQDSLFSSVQSSNGTRIASIDERALRKDSDSGSHTASKADSYRTDDIPALNVHGLVSVTKPEKTMV